MSEPMRVNKSGPKISREEIIKMFDLPERKSKIDTILKLRVEHDQQVYCICQSTDISKFMIGCEKCDEWYHGDCIGFDERDAHLIKKWYCRDCIKKYGLKVVYFNSEDQQFSHKKNKEKKLKRQDRYPYLRRGACGKCSNCLQNEECGNKDFPVFSENPMYPVYENKDVKKTFTSTHNVTEDQAKKFHEEKIRIENEERSFVGLRRKRCLNCRSNMCRIDSKYCSSKCGMALAKARLCSIVPTHFTSDDAFENRAQVIDKARLENISLQKKEILEQMERLDSKEEKLRELIERAKKLPIIDFQEEIEDQTKAFCVTCGWEIPSRLIIRHMEHCFRKCEAQTAVEGLTKSNSERCHIFCDHYNTAKKTFCRRLRYVCPLHFKPMKAGDNEVCGCPVMKPYLCSSIFPEPEKFCQKPKKTCSQHYNWENLVLSDIDLERHKEWIKMHTLIEQEAIIAKQIVNRLGVVPLLLHSTTMNN